MILVKCIRSAPNLIERDINAWLNKMQSDPNTKFDLKDISVIWGDTAMVSYEITSQEVKVCNETHNGPLHGGG